MVLGIYGASGLGREILELARLINDKENRWDDFIFIDDGDVPSVVSGKRVYKYEEAKEKFGSQMEIVMGIGEPATREMLFDKIEKDGIFTPTLIHPDVHVPESTKVGTGVVIQYGCFISCDVVIGDYVYIVVPDAGIKVYDIKINNGYLWRWYSMIALYLLEQFDAFARLGTLSKAAEELHISQPALTRSMKKIEEEMGIALFHRDLRKLTLNTAGKVVAEYARRILADEREMLERAYEADRRERTLILGSCGVMAVNHLIPVLTQSFSGKSILTEIAPDEVLLARLKNRSCQFAVLHDRPADPAVFYQRYLREQIYISVPDSHPLASRTELTAVDLEGCSILTFDVGFWVGLCRERLPHTSFLIQTDADTMIELVEASDLFVFNSDQMLRDGYIPPRRKNLPLKEDFADVVYYVACLDSEKTRYTSFFNAIRADSITQSVRKM